MSRRTGLVKKFGFLAMTLGFLAASRDASAIEQKGFIAGLGFGGGRIGCLNCGSLSGGAGVFHVGWMLT